MSCLTPAVTIYQPLIYQPRCERCKQFGMFTASCGAIKVHGPRPSQPFELFGLTRRHEHHLTRPYQTTYFVFTANIITVITTAIMSSFLTNTTTPNLKSMADELKVMIVRDSLRSSDPVLLSSALPNQALALLAVDRELHALADPVFYQENIFSVARASDTYSLRSLPESTRNKIVSFALPVSVGINATRLRQLKSAFRKRNGTSNLRSLSLGTVGDYRDDEPQDPAAALHQHLLNTHPALAELCAALPNVAVEIRTRSYVFDIHERVPRPNNKHWAKGVVFCRERVWAVSAPNNTVQVELVACNDSKHRQQNRIV